MGIKENYASLWNSTIALATCLQLSWKMQVSLLVGVTRNSLPKSKQSLKGYDKNLCDNNDLLLYHINKKIVFCINSFAN